MTQSTVAELTNQLNQLTQQRDTIDITINTLQNTLKKQNTDMVQPLVDAQGFPRSDMDVYLVRTTRTSLIRLINDRKDFTNQIEKCLHKIHTIQSKSGPNEFNRRNNNNVCFAIVNSLADNSPARESGLMVGDKIIRFGGVSKLELMPGFVVQNENVS